MNVLPGVIEFLKNLFQPQALGPDPGLLGGSLGVRFRLTAFVAKLLVVTLPAVLRDVRPCNFGGYY